MSELHSTDSYLNRSLPTQLVSTLRNPEELKTIHDLFAVLRVSVLSSVKIKSSLPGGSLSSPTTMVSPATAASESAAAGAGIVAESVTSAGEGHAAQTLADESSTINAAGKSETQPTWPQEKTKNAQALKSVFGSISESMKVFFTGKCVWRRVLVPLSLERELIPHIH